MPLTPKGRKIKSAMTAQYGAKKGKQVFHASQNKGTITGTHRGNHEPKAEAGVGRFATGRVGGVARKKHNPGY